MGDDDQPSLEYIEDSYLPSLPATATPSLDELNVFDNTSLFDDDYDDYDADQEGRTAAIVEWSAETEMYLRSMPLEQIFCISDDHHDDLQKVEAELSDVHNDQENNNSVMNARTRTQMFIKKLFTKKSMRDVRVTFIDLSKPYLAKISSSDNYKSFLNIGSHGMFSICVEKKNCIRFLLHFVCYLYKLLLYGLTFNFIGKEKMC